MTRESVAAEKAFDSLELRRRGAALVCWVGGITWVDKYGAGSKATGSR
jgi:hypothetical protein